MSAVHTLDLPLQVGLQIHLGITRQEGAFQLTPQGSAKSVIGHSCQTMASTPSHAQH